MFHIRLKELRKEKNLKLKDIAALLELAPSSVGMYENNKRYPNIIAISRLAVFFNVSVDYMLGISDIRENTAQQIKEYIKNPDIVKMIKLTQQLPESDLKVANEFIEYLVYKNQTQDEDK